jgi:hypothetical protein
MQTYDEGFQLGYDFGRKELPADEIADLLFAGEYEFLKGFVDGCLTREADDRELMKS